MSDYYPGKDNEFIAWYPACVKASEVEGVWAPRRAGYYIHIPFCTAVCDYCGFAVERKKGANTARYLAALRAEIERYAQSGRLANYRFDCGHFGGGTPSAIDADDLLMIKRLIDASFGVAPDAEVTVEVNPISFTLPMAEAYRSGGVNRISFGVQSFHDRLLKIIGRPHRAHDVESTLDVIRRVGWDNFSLDIIYGVPSQSLAELRDDLLRAVDTGAAHLSCFRLEIIPFTTLKLREAAGLIPARPPVGLLDEMDDLVSSTLTANGYREYGAFNYARPGFESVHNAIAFIAPQGEYIGFGNSSYSFINGYIYCNHADTATYEKAVLEGRDPIALARRVDGLEAMSRYFVLGLKFFRVPRPGFVARFGIQPEEVFGPTLERLVAAGMLARDGDDYLLTRAGRRYINNVCKEFYTDENRGIRQHQLFVPTITPEQIEYYARLGEASGALSGLPNEWDAS